tara:strand:- start:3020 stop:3205 length:186 start_codon:yes stop_codon:yes gene_type:complete
VDIDGKKVSFRSLPYRQLRNLSELPEITNTGSLPYRQLRNFNMQTSYKSARSLPYRQLRNI